MELERLKHEYLESVVKNTLKEKEDYLKNNQKRPDTI